MSFLLNLIFSNLSSVDETAASVFDITSNFFLDEIIRCEWPTFLNDDSSNGFLAENKKCNKIPKNFRNRKKFCSIKNLPVIIPNISDSDDDDFIHENEFRKFADYDFKKNEDAKCFYVYCYKSQDKNPFWKTYIRINSDATISELKGLICYKYIKKTENHTLKLKALKSYKIYIMDDNEIESDFPPFDDDLNISKIFFQSLALVIPIQY